MHGSDGTTLNAGAQQKTRLQGGFGALVATVTKDSSGLELLVALHVLSDFGDVALFSTFFFFLLPKNGQGHEIYFPLRY